MSFWIHSSVSMLVLCALLIIQFLLDTSYQLGCNSHLATTPQHIYIVWFIFKHVATKYILVMPKKAQLRPKVEGRSFINIVSFVS